MKKRLSVLMLFVALFVPWAITAQSLENYGFTTGVDATKWVSMTGATQILSPTGNDGLASSVQTIGFTFPFGASTYTQYSVNTDGNLRLGATATGTSYYTTPFSSTNANNNNPKINAFGCDGYGNSGTHYVKAKQVVTDDGDTLLAVEFCMGTYNSTTRSELYKWQIHLYANGNIDIVFPSASALPSTAPAVAHQCGICASSSDGWIISAATNTAMHFTAGSSVTNATGTWFDANRYYTFIHPSNISCPAPTGVTVSNITTDGADISWTAGGTESAWELMVGDDTYYPTDTFYTLTNLDANTPYTVSVRAICGYDDTSFASSNTFRTACAPLATLPYTENFDGVAGATTTSVAENNLPPCWANHNVGTSTSYSGYPIVYNSSTYAHSGSQAMRFYTYITAGTYADQYAIMPITDSNIYPINTLQLDFWMRSTSTSYSSWGIVGVMTDPADATTFVPVDTVRTNASTTYAHHEVLFDNYTGAHGCVAFKFPQPASSYNAALVDDVTLRVIPSCYWPTAVNVVSVGENEATISWIPDSRTANPSSWEVEYGLHGFTRGQGDLASVYDTAIILMNLSPNTQYDIYISANCGGDVSDPATITFRTACGAWTVIPLVENFDSVAGSTSTTPTASFLPPCWSYFNHGTRASYMYCPYVYNSSTYSHSGANCIRFYSYNTSADSNQYLILPLIDSTVYPVNELQLSFWMRGYSTSSGYYANVVVGVMTNPMDESSFVPVANFSSTSTTYAQYECNFALYTGNHGNIALKFPKPTTSSSYNYGYVDDIVVEPMPSCGAVVDLEATATVGAALLTWGYQDGYNEPMSYEVTYDSIGGSNPTVLTPSEPTVTLTGLAAGTTYKAYIQADCGSDGMGRLDSIEFTTEAFACMSGIDEVQFSNSTSGVSGCMAYSSYGNTVYQAVWTAAELTAAGLTAGPITAIDLGFTSSTYPKEFTIYLGTTTTSSISDATIASLSTHTLVYGPAEHPAGTTGWQHYEFTTPFVWNGTSNIMMTTFMNQPTGVTQTASTGLTGYYVSAANKARYRYKDSSPFTTTTLTSGNAGSTYSYRAAIHFYSGECTAYASCAAPAVALIDIASTTADITWIPGYDEDEWNVDYRVAGTNDWINAATGVTTTTFTFDNLTPATNYEFRVSFTCNDSANTLYAGTVTARTPCVAISVPYSYGFEDMATTSSSAHPDIPCWHHLNNGTSYPGYPYVSSTAHNSNRSLYWGAVTTTGTYGDYQVVVLPQIDTVASPINTLQLSFWARPSSTSYAPVFQVGVMTDPENVNSFQVVGTVNVPSVSTDWTFYEVPLNSYTGNGSYIAVRANRPTSAWYAYTDDFTVDVIPSCPHVTNLVVDTATENSITIAWTPRGDETQWSVTYDNHYFTTTDTFFTATGLTVNTPYTFAVRSLCSTTDSSVAWTLDARTACAQYLSLPYSENFDGFTNSTTAATGVEVPCWNHLMTGTSTYQVGSYLPQMYYYVNTSSAIYNHSGNYSLRLYGVSYTTLPQLPVPANQVTMGFWSKSTGTSYKLAVGVMTDPNDATTFDTIQEITYTTATAAAPLQYFEIDFSDYVGTGRYIAFRNYYTSTSTYYSYHYIDDIEVWQNSTCPTPAVNVANVESNSITVTWYDTVYGGYGNGAIVSWNTQNDFGTAQNATVATGNSYTITGLTPSTHYYVWVAGNCLEESSRPVRVQATTADACAPIENLTTSSVTDNSFGISWNAPTVGNAATSYIIYLRKCTNTAWDTVEHWIIDTTSNTYYLFSGLDAATTYAYAVRTVCGSNYANYDGGYVTTTICEMDTVGDYGTNYSAQPLYTSQSYAYTQQIYLASELAGIDSISSIALYQRGYAYNDRNVTVYLGYTSKSQFTSTTDVVPFSNLTQVYSGNLGGFGWVSLKFDSVYVRNVDSNLVVAIDDNTGVVSPYSTNYWACTNFGDIYRSIRYYGSNINPADPSGTSARDYYRAYIVFGNADCELSECREPIVMLTGLTNTTASFTWNAQPETSYEVAYRLLGETNWTVVAAANTTGSATITGLAPALQGEVRVSYICDGLPVSGTMTFTMPCGAAGLPLVEDFETHDYGTFERPCWISGSTYLGTTNPLPRVTSLTGSDDMICHFQNGAYLILPQVSEVLDSLQIRFQLTQGNDDATLLLGLMNDASLPIYAMYVLDTLNRHSIDTTTATVNITYQFAGIPAAYQNARIAFWDANGSYSFLNDIVVEYVPHCTPASDFTATATTNSATISWTNNGENGTSYIVEYGPRYFTPGTGTTVTGAASPITLTGLNHSTSYDAYVYTVCAVSNDTSIASQVIQFATECDVISTLPYTVNFDGVLAPGSSSNTALPNCWASAAISGIQPHVIYTSTSSQASSGSYCMYFSAPGVAAMPEMGLALNTMKVSFHVANSTPTAYGLIIGTVDVMDTGLVNSFVPYDTIDFVDGMTQATVYMNDYTGTANHIAFKSYNKSGGTSVAIYIDDVVVDTVGSCIPPQHIHLEYATGTEASLAWNRSNASSYTIIYGIHNSSTVATEYTSNRNILLTGLSPQTQYDVMIVSGCSNDTATFTFTTPCAAVTLPYTENFDSYTTSTTAATGVHVNCWEYTMLGTSTYQAASYQPQLYYSSSNANSGSYSLRLYGTSYTMLPPMPTSLDSLVLTFANYATAAAYLLEVGVMEGNTFVPYATITNPASTHVIHKVYFNNYHGTSRTIAFHNYNSTATTYYSYNYIDDVHVDYIPSCPEITGLEAVAYADSVTLTWHRSPAGNESNWIVNYNGGTPVTVNDSVYTVTGLTPNTNYTFSVRPYCAVGDTGTVETIAVHTLCLPTTLPYSENFDNLTTSTTAVTGVHVSCWEYIMTGTATYQAASYQPQVYYSSTYAHSGSYSLRLNGISYTMLPTMPTSLDSLELTFWDYTTSVSYGLEVGVMEGNTFVPIQTISTPASSHAEYIVDFGTYTGTSRIIAFRNYYTTSTTTYTSLHYIDNIHVDYLPSCPRVLDVHAVTAGTSSITIDWQDQAPAAMWEIEYGSMGHSVGSGTTVQVTSHPTTITGLSALTSYDFYVRPLCTSTDTGMWSNKVTLSTATCNGAFSASTGTATGTSYVAPVNNFYNYTLSETIIDSAELAGIGDISIIAYSYAYATASTDKTSVTIWLQPTTKTSFSNTSDMVPLNNATAVKVYQGNLNCSQGWNYFTLDTTYTWDGHSNLLVIVDDNSGDYNGSAYTFNTVNCTGDKTIVYYSDSNNPVPTSPSSFSGSMYTYTWRPAMQLISCGAAPCDEPTIVYTTPEETALTVKVATADSSDATIEAVITDQPWSDLLASSLPSVTINYPTVDSVRFTGLTGNTDYTVAVRRVCSGSTRSAWTTQPVTTLRHPCAVPGTPQVSGNTYDGATVTWTAGENETEWELKVFCNSPVYEHTYTVSDTPSQVVSGLDAATTYSVTVRALCDSAWYSVWSDTVDLTTITCPIVTGVTASNVTATGATISWNSTNAVKYEIEYGEMGFQTGTGNTVVTTNTTITLNNLEEQSTYDVFVRGYCTEDVAADWSERYRFNTPAAGNGIADVENSNVTLYPNPASSMVTIGGLEGESTVTVVDLNGREVYRDHTGANGHSGQATATGSVTIDVSGYAKGAYFVRVTGESTTAIRKLIVK